MKTLDEIAQALRAIDSHRVEATPTEGNPNSLDVVIVQEFPPPKKRHAIRIEKAQGGGWLCHPVAATDSHIAQFVAMKLQVATTGSDDVRSQRNGDGLFAVAFRTDAPKADAAPQPAPKRTKDPVNVEASV